MGFLQDDRDLLTLEHVGEDPCVGSADEDNVEVVLGFECEDGTDLPLGGGVYPEGFFLLQEGDHGFPTLVEFLEGAFALGLVVGTGGKHGLVDALKVVSGTFFLLLGRGRETAAAEVHVGPIEVEGIVGEVGGLFPCPSVELDDGTTASEQATLGDDLG